MYTGALSTDQPQPSGQNYNAAYLWAIASVAALGGLLFGYDWVVIGGAKPFYEAYFHLNSAGLIGWANSCALVGCLAGSLAAGGMSDRFGRKPILLFSAILFALSSVLTGWAHEFSTFVFWRIMGGAAIGFASNVSPIYIAEISPAPMRGRLVSLNQLSIVVGILASQIVNWLIAEKVPAKTTGFDIAASWNAHYGWRWMFTAVALPAVVFFFAVMAIPESPRWLVGRDRDSEARDILARIGGPVYASEEAARIRSSFHTEQASRVPWREVFAPRFHRVLLIGITLAVLQQWSGINVLFNYAQEIYAGAGYGLNAVMFNIVITGIINLVFTIAALALVDRLGRRALMLLGCGGVGLAHLLAALAYFSRIHGTPVLLLTLAAIACYAASLAPVTWVLIAELFPNQIRSTGVSIAISALWSASFLLTYTFPFMERSTGISGTFLIYALICFLGLAFVFMFVPETKGKSLEAIERSFSAASGVAN
jgi:SP family xylose:H+ symportor-like MFS transporter